MRVIGIVAPGGPEALTEHEVPVPEAGVGEVRIRVRAVAVNPVDTLLRAGNISTDGFRPPHVPGMDAAGIVDQVGDGVQSWAVGDEVMAFAHPLTAHGGSYVDQLVAPADAIAAVPHGMSLDEAATLPMNGLTALQIVEKLVRHDASIVAVTGSAGVLGGYVIQLAKERGMRVVADAAESDAKLVRELGADMVVRRGDGVADAVRRAIPGGVDGIVDTALMHAQVLPAVRDGGIYVAVRRWRGESTRGIVFDNSAVADEYHVGGRLEDVAKAAERGVLVPRVAAVMSASQAAEAHRLLAQGGTRGRYVLRF